MARALLFLVLLTSLLLIPSRQTHLQEHEEAFISIYISQQGLDFLKDVLINKSQSAMLPIRLPKIAKTAKVPFLGNVHMVLSNITIYQIQVLNSYVKPGDTGIVIIASGTTCNLSVDWYYEYNTWLLPLEITDKVEVMEVGFTLGLKNQEGTLRLSLMESGCYVKDISIKLDGGASWLYQGMIDAFKVQIASAVENAITKNLGEGILKLDLYLLSPVKEIPVDEHTSLNVTFVNDPLLSNSSIGFNINWLFIARKRVPLVMHHHANLQPSVFCTESTKMLGISIDEAVFNSASALYYDAKFMQWIVDKIPDQSLLNTAGWRFIVPLLYKKYPNDDMNVNISLSSPPFIRIFEHDIDATIFADLIIDVLETDRVIPVACISLVIRGSGSVGIAGNNLVGSVKLNDFSMSLKWSNIGNLRMHLILPLLRTVIRTVFVPYANAHLAKGFPLTIVNGFTVQDAKIICSRSTITVCGNVAFRDRESQSASAPLGVKSY